MKQKISIILLIALLPLLLSGCGALRGLRNIIHFGEKDTLYYGVTARQWLPFIEEKAKSWREDAYLYGISEAEVRPDGSSDKWHYLFYSPGSEKTAVFVYESGFISIKEIVLPPLNSVGSFKIDSPTALNIAKEKQAEFLNANPSVIMLMSLVGPSFESSKNNSAKWLVKFYGSAGAQNILIDAYSGKLLN